MSEKFKVEIISPDRLVLKKEAREVSLPCYEGEMGILKDHISLITFLRPGFIKIFNEKVDEFFVEEGTVEFTNNNLLILTSSAIRPSEIDKKSLNNLIFESEKKINNNETSDKERYLESYKIESLKSINQ
tara:strand:- start:1662 stop:2051 length:390 start_codon:yes stop_codon:yes gene_type:complete